MLYLFEDIALDADRRELRRGNILVSIEPRVFDLLVYVIRNRERVVEKDDLIASVWEGRIVSDSALTTCINAARSTIGDSGEAQRLIKTLPRKGIRFVGVVREEEKPAGLAATAIAAESPGPVLALPDKPSIAVLPFTNMSGDPEQEYFADGMAEEIITGLSRCSWLFVIARNSSFTYKGRAVDIRQVGRDLGVRYVLEGSVRRGGNRMRFTGQLIDATSGAHIWADRFDGEMSDVFDLQDRITENVVAAIEPKLQLAEIERLKRKPAANLNAYDHLLRAQQLEYEFTDDSLNAAIRHCKRALDIDPAYAPAMALAAYCYGERRFQGWTRDLAAENSEGLGFMSQALELGKFDPNVLWMCALSYWQLGLDTQRAKELAYRSLETNPNSAIAWTIAGWIEAYSGNYAKGKELLGRAQRQSPRDPRAWFTSSGMAIASLGEGKFDDGAAWARKALAQNARYTVAMRLLAANLANLGQVDPARASVADFLRIEPDLTMSKLRARLMFMNESLWGNLSRGLRLGGLPD